MVVIVSENTLPFLPSRILAIEARPVFSFCRMNQQSESDDDDDIDDGAKVAPAA